MQPIPAQIPIIEAVKAGKTISVDAVPGGGKSTILKMIDNMLMNRNFLSLMFSKNLAAELKSEFQFGTVATLHAHGLKACSQHLRLTNIKMPVKKVNGQYERSYVHEDVLDFAIFQYLKKEFQLASAIPKLLFIQNENIPFNIVVQTIAQIVDKIRLNAIHFSHHTNIHLKFDSMFGQEMVGHGINVLTELVELYYRFRGQIDYTGMLYIPVVLPEVSKQIITPEILAVDESQDSNPLMQEMYKLIAKNAKQVILLGDSNQTIHIWNNTSPIAFSNLAKFFSAEAISYNVSFRLPKAVTNYLNISGLDRTITAWTDKQGSISEISLNKAMMKEFRPGDWVLGRFNRTKDKNFLSLEKLSIELLKLGKNVRLLGSEYIAICKKGLALVGNSTDPLRKLNEIVSEQIAKLDKEKGLNNYKSRRLLYELEIFTLYYNFYLGKNSKKDFISFLETMYSNDDENSITLCTYHRSKGKEAKRIFLMHVDIIYADIVNTELSMAERIEARNLLYVGITRTLEYLFIIDGKLPTEYPTLEYVEE
jgi:hypothetical protein